MRADRRTAGEAGFTLIELVVCLGLLALIAATVGQGMAILKQGQTVLARAELRHLHEAAETHLRRTIERSVARFSADETGERKLLFEGGGSSLRLVTRADGRLEHSGLVLAGFRMDEANGTGVLVTDRQPFGAGRQAGPDRATFTLLEGVEALGFRYFGALAEGAPPDWSSEWSNAQNLPELIEVRISFEGGAVAPITFAAAMPVSFLSQAGR